MNDERLNERLNNIEHRLEKVNFELGKLIGSQKTTTMLIRYVVLPLIIVLGALIGIKIF